MTGKNCHSQGKEKNATNNMLRKLKLFANCGAIIRGGSLRG